MTKDLFSRYIWLADTIARAGGITFAEISRKWAESAMSDGKELPLKTFHNHRIAVQETFGINIECRRKDGYRYYIENVNDLRHNTTACWLLETFSINNLISESHKVKDRILLEEIPSGQKHLSAIIEAMKDSMTLSVTHASFWKDTTATFEVEPYCVKVFRQRWYMLARSVKYGNIRVYCLDRISAVRNTGKSFIFPEDFDPAGYFQKSFGIIVDEAYPPEIIRIQAYGTKVKYLRSLPLHHSQKEVYTAEGYSDFQYYMSPTYDLKQELLSHGDEITVLAPEHLRDEIMATAERIAAKYRTPRIRSENS